MRIYIHLQVSIYLMAIRRKIPIGHTLKEQNNKTRYTV